MEEKELIRELKIFSKIKPDKNWVVLSKREIFKEEEKTQERFLFPWKVFISTLSIITLLLFAIYFQTNINNKIAEISKNLFAFESKDQKTAQISESIKAINENLNKVEVSLDNIKENKDKINKKEVLGITQVVKNTVQNSKEIAKKIESAPDIKNQKEISKTLGVIVETSDKIREKSEELQIEMIKALISDLSKRSLSLEDSQKLEKAKDYFEKGDIQTAIILLSQIGSY